MKTYLSTMFLLAILAFCAGCPPHRHPATPNGPGAALVAPHAQDYETAHVWAP